MNIFLADPPHHFLAPDGHPVSVHPLGIGYLAAVLSPRHDVRQLIPDVRPRRADEDPWQLLADVLRAEAPQLLGIGALTATFPAALKLAQLARDTLGPDLVIVIGGVHSSFQPLDAFRCPAVDYVVRGEGEETLDELVSALEAGAESDALLAIPGLIVRGPDGQPRFGPPRAAIADLDALPFPRRDGIIWAEHLHPTFFQSLITVRGCPYTCIYCSVPQSSQRRTRYRSATNIADEIEVMVRRWDVPYLFFHDSVFTLNRKRTMALMDQLIERDLVVPYACQTRADRVDPELLERMKAGGCHQIFFGIESGDLESLEKMSKLVPLEKVREAVDQVKALGIRAAGFFMVGFPWETEVQIERTADFATDLGLDSVSLFSATPLPGTALWDMVDDSRLPDSIDFRRPAVNVTGLPDATYAALFNRVKARVDAYNQQQMTASVMNHWPRG